MKKPCVSPATVLRKVEQPLPGGPGRSLCQLRRMNVEKDSIYRGRRAFRQREPHHRDRTRCQSCAFWPDRKVVVTCLEAVVVRCQRFSGSQHHCLWYCISICCCKEETGEKVPKPYTFKSLNAKPAVRAWKFSGSRCCKCSRLLMKALGLKLGE